MMYSIIKKANSTISLTYKSEQQAKKEKAHKKQVGKHTYINI